MIHFSFVDNKVIIKLKSRVCDTPNELISSNLFLTVLTKCIQHLSLKESKLLRLFGEENRIKESEIQVLIEVFQFLLKIPLHYIAKIVNSSEKIVENPKLLFDFVEYLYNYWRSFERFILCNSENDELDKRPYRTFHSTIEALNHLIRGAYRKIQENIIGEHPKIYRQIVAGAEIGCIIIPKLINYTNKSYQKLNPVPVIRQVLIYPPLLLNPPMNKRSGEFQKVTTNPLDLIDIKSETWICYPALVGQLLINVYIHEKFYELGLSLCNLFELADDEVLKQKKPDAVFLYGVPNDELYQLAEFPTIFYEDAENSILVGAIPNKNEFGYFGYLKKMILTLYNIINIKKGFMPFHGAMIRIQMKGNKNTTVLLIGDTGAGKSETIEALRNLAQSEIEDLIIIADDMGVLSLDENGGILGYGSEIGAFVRLDDLNPGFAFGQIDRTILMNPGQTNARVIIPVTTYGTITKGFAVDYILYANNYEEIDETHPVIEKINTVDGALEVFKRGTSMSKGTTTSTGLTHTYFVNVFGPVQYRELHDRIAEKYLAVFFKKGIFVGQMRTQLGIPGKERRGPEASAQELLNLILK